MGSVIKAIETHYKGYHFRSRLEARWAVFFDALGVWYEYEMEGYDLGKAGWYLPDFWLPRQEIIVEVKPLLLGGGYPNWPDSTKQEALVHGLPESGLYHQMAILCGTPGPEEDCYEGFKIYPSGGIDFGHYWCECSQCGCIGFEFGGETTRLCCGCRKDGPRITSHLQAAYAAARSARF